MLTFQGALRVDENFEAKVVVGASLMRCWLLLDETHSCISSSLLEPFISQVFGLSPSR